MKRKLALVFTVLWMVFCAVPHASATEGEPIEIGTVEELMAIADNPSGSYILTEDLDMEGISWQSIDFSGSFDGNHHAILNLTLSQPGENTPESCDGNKILYESRYVGLFGTLTNAEVKNLQLINVRGCVETDASCFVGGIAGYMADSVISGCTVTGTMELRAHDMMFGIGGIVGYGGGTIENSTVDVTLICVDTDAETKDEQFLGGAYSTGFIDVIDCNITIDGYISDHGYVHSGGITGMYMEYPLGTGMIGRVYGNSITGKITFFEDNLDRRAYCKVLFGEVLINNCKLENNVSDFKRDETFDYSRELRPHMCDSMQFEQTITPSGCDTFGFTTYTCEECGYSYTDHYTLHSHKVSEWTLINAPTTQEEGLSLGYCDECGVQQTRVEQTLPPTEPETTQEPSESACVSAPIETESVFKDQVEKTQTHASIYMVAALAIGIAIIVMVTWNHKKKQ